LDIIWLFQKITKRNYRIYNDIIEDNTLEKLISSINEIHLDKEVYEDEKNKKKSEVEDKESNDMKNLKDIIQYLKKFQRMVLIYVIF